VTYVGRRITTAQEGRRERTMKNQVRARGAGRWADNAVEAKQRRTAAAYAEGEDGQRGCSEAACFFGDGCDAWEGNVVKCAVVAALLLHVDKCGARNWAQWTTTVFSTSSEEGCRQSGSSRSPEDGCWDVQTGADAIHEREIQLMFFLASRISPSPPTPDGRADGQLASTGNGPSASSHRRDQALVAAERDVEMVGHDGRGEREHLWRMEVLGWPGGTLTALARG
jgi:hypothetical protein